MVFCCYFSNVRPIYLCYRERYEKTVFCTCSRSVEFLVPRDIQPKVNSQINRSCLPSQRQSCDFFSKNLRIITTADIEIHLLATQRVFLTMKFTVFYWWILRKIKILICYLAMCLKMFPGTSNVIFVIDNVANNIVQKEGWVLFLNRYFSFLDFSNKFSSAYLL